MLPSVKLGGWSAILEGAIVGFVLRTSNLMFERGRPVGDYLWDFNAS